MAAQRSVESVVRSWIRLSLQCKFIAEFYASWRIFKIGRSTFDESYKVMEFGGWPDAINITRRDRNLETRLNSYYCLQKLKPERHYSHCRTTCTAWITAWDAMIVTSDVRWIAHVFHLQPRAAATCQWRSKALRDPDSTLREGPSKSRRVEAPNLKGWDRGVGLWGLWQRAPPHPAGGSGSAVSSPVGYGANPQPLRVLMHLEHYCETSAMPHNKC